jgi:hypothetical protein
MSVVLEPDSEASDNFDNDDDRDSDPSSLLSLCRAATTLADLQQIVSLITVEAASVADRHGQTALHALAQNQALTQAITLQQQQQHHLVASLSSSSKWRASPSPSRGVLDRAISTASSTSTGMTMSQTTDEEQHLAEVVELLWRAYPPAMMTTDNKGHIPFESALREWVDASYETTTQQRSNSSRSLSSYQQPHQSLLPSLWDFKDSVASRWVNGSGGYQNHRNSKSSLVTTSQDNAGANATTDIETGLPIRRLLPRDRTFPSRVRMTAHAFFSIKMLSVFLDRMATTINEMAGNNSNARSFFAHIGKRKVGGRTLLDELQNITVQDMSASIVHSVASIPDLVKTILFIKDQEHRNQCLGTALIRRVLTSKHSIGSWLTGMLQSDDKQASDLALDYLHIVSNANFDDDGVAVRDSPNTTTPSRKRFEDEKSRDEFYQEVSRLQDFVPSLLSLGETQIEEAATTKVVQQVLDRIISRPFAVTVVFCDALFLVLLISSYRSAINGVLLGSSPGAVLRSCYIANIGTFYFLIREIGKAISLCMITRRARVYFVSFWNLADLLTTILALVSTIAIRSHFSGLRSLCAVTTGFMWLRVLSYLKGINISLATFVLAILQVRHCCAMCSSINRNCLTRSCIVDHQRYYVVLRYSIYCCGAFFSDVFYFVGTGRVLGERRNA